MAVGCLGLCLALFLDELSGPVDELVLVEYLDEIFHLDLVRLQQRLAFLALGPLLLVFVQGLQARVQLLDQAQHLLSRHGEAETD